MFERIEIRILNMVFLKLFETKLRRLNNLHCLCINLQVKPKRNRKKEYINK